MCFMFFFFFKQKTAYEMRISDWSSDVCSSDLQRQTCIRRRASPGQFVSSVRWRKYATAAAIRCGWNMLPVYRDWQLSLTHRLCLILPDARSSARRRILIEIGKESFRERVCQYV